MTFAPCASRLIQAQWTAQCLAFNLSTVQLFLQHSRESREDCPEHPSYCQLSGNQLLSSCQLTVGALLTGELRISPVSKTGTLAFLGTRLLTFLGTDALHRLVAALGGLASSLTSVSTLLKKSPLPVPSQPFCNSSKSAVFSASSVLCTAAKP
jgi:hypothetical protein